MNRKKSPIKAVVILCILMVIIMGIVKSGALEYLRDRQKLEILIKSLGMWGPLDYTQL